MITLKQFYFEPNSIDSNEITPIVFEKGLNIILGERSDNSEKMNSVGKSLLIDMINYCLLSDSSTRIYKIPKNILNDDTYMCLDLEIETTKRINILTIKRSRDIEKPILITINGEDQDFEKIEQAKELIESLVLNSGAGINKPTFRNLVSVLLREEKSSFDDILRPYASKSFLDFNELIRPHLYLFGIDISIVNNMKHVQKNISETETVINNLNKDFKNLGIDKKTVRSHINNLKEIVDKLNLSIKELKPGEGLQQSQQKLQELEQKMSSLITKKVAKYGAIYKIKQLPVIDEVDSKKIKIIYNIFKEGLGTIVKKSIDEVKEFHGKIETFQNQLFNQKLKDLQKEIEELDGKIVQLDKQISDIYKTFKADEKIDSLKRVLKEERERNSELENLSEKYNSLEKKIEEKKIFEIKRTELLTLIDQQIISRQTQIAEFEEDLKTLHDIITGNKKCQFDIRTSTAREYVAIDYRIDLDGGSGMDRIRTFMYDALLLLSKVTCSKHLGFLIHDNIFPSTGRDDMVKALNYIYDQSVKGNSFQYIVTLNTDEFEAQINKFSFKTTELTRASFTREKPFLGTQYRES